MQYAVLGMFPYRDYLFNQHMSDFGHQCSARFPVGYICSDSNSGGSDDGESLLKATLQTYIYAVIIVGSTAIAKATYSGIQAYRYYPETTAELKEPASTSLWKDCIKGTAQAAASGMISASTLFYISRELLPLLNDTLPISLNYAPATHFIHLPFRIYNEEAFGYFTIYAPLIIGKNVIYQLGKISINAFWDKFSNNTKRIFDAGKKGYAVKPIDILGICQVIYFPLSDILFSQMMQEFGHPCPLKFPVGFQCQGNQSEFNDFAYGFSRMKSLKYAFLIYGPGCKYGYGFFKATKSMYYEFQKIKAEKNLDLQSSESTFCSPEVRLTSKFLGFGFINGIDLSYAIYYLIREFTVHIQKINDIQGNVDQIFKNAVEDTSTYFNICAPIGTGLLTLLSFIKARQDIANMQRALPAPEAASDAVYHSLNVP